MIFGISSSGSFPIWRWESSMWYGVAIFGKQWRCSPARKSRSFFWGHSAPGLQTKSFGSMFGTHRFWSSDRRLQAYWSVPSGWEKGGLALNLRCLCSLVSSLPGSFLSPRQRFLQRQTPYGFRLYLVLLCLRVHSGYFFSWVLPIVSWMCPVTLFSSEKPRVICVAVSTAYCLHQSAEPGSCLLW